MYYGHKLLDKLWLADQEAQRRFPCEPWRDPGLGSVGLLFHKKLDHRCYKNFTPLNCLTFASTGGNGTHFSFLTDFDSVNENSPVVITIPPMGNFIVGADFHEFLCLGVVRGYFCLEHLAYNQETTLEACLNPEWIPIESSHESVGLGFDDHKSKILAFLKETFCLKPWANIDRFTELQNIYGPMLQLPNE